MILATNFDFTTFYFVLNIILMVFMVLLSIAMIVIVVMQQGNESNLGAITGAADTFFGKNKSKTLDSKFKRWTVGIAIGILVCSVLFFVIAMLAKNV